MALNNYEKYATIKQQELLNKTRTLSQAINCLRDRKRFSSLQSIEDAIDFISDLYDLSADEVRRAVNGDEYWCI